MLDIEALQRSLKQAQSKASQLQAQRKNLQANAEAGAGLVKATVNGEGKLLAVQVDESLLTAEKKQMLEDLVVAAHNLALARMDELLKQQVQAQGQTLMAELLGKHS